MMGPMSSATPFRMFIDRIISRKASKEKAQRGGDADIIAILILILIVIEMEHGSRFAQGLPFFAMLRTAQRQDKLNRMERYTHERGRFRNAAFP